MPLHFGSLGRLSLDEWVVAVGGFLSVVGQTLFAMGVGSPQVSQTIRHFGFAIFITGIVLVIRDISKRLVELKNAQELAAHKSVIDDVRYWAEASAPKWLHVSAASDVVHDLLSEYLPKLTDSLRKVRADPKVTIEVDDHSPIHDLMYRLGRTLPIGSVWMGITLLESKAAWDAPEGDRFRDFKETMRSRAATHELRVLRLYYFHDSEALNALMNDMIEEARCRIDVRYLVGGASVPPDISLLWVPSKRGAARPVAAPAGPDILDAVKGPGYDPLCALEYATRGGTLLTRLAVHPVASQNFEKLYGRFARFWEKATLVEYADVFDQT